MKALVSRILLLTLLREAQLAILPHCFNMIGTSLKRQHYLRTHVSTIDLGISVDAEDNIQLKADYGTWTTLLGKIRESQCVT